MFSTLGAVCFAKALTNGDIHKANLCKCIILDQQLCAMVQGNSDLIRHSIYIDPIISCDLLAIYDKNNCSGI